MDSLQAAAKLEHWLTMNVDAATEIKLLGRFDSVFVAVTEEQAECLILSNGGRIQTNAAVRIDRIIPVH
jgi:hypothetical protein